MPDTLVEAIRILLEEGGTALQGHELEVTSVTVEWAMKDGKMRPQLFVVLEPKDT